MSSPGLIAGISVVAVLLFLLLHIVLFVRHVKRSGEQSAASGVDEDKAQASPDVGFESSPTTDEAPSAPDVPAAQLGVRAFMRGDYERAFELLQPAAEQGNLKAQQLLAKMYYAGHGVEQNRDQYLYWLQRCADNGDKPAKSKLKKVAAHSR